MVYKRLIHILSWVILEDCSKKHPSISGAALGPGEFSWDSCASRDLPSGPLKLTLEISSEPEGSMS